MRKTLRIAKYQSTYVGQSKNHNGQKYKQIIAHTQMT